MRASALGPRYSIGRGSASAPVRISLGRRAYQAGARTTPLVESPDLTWDLRARPAAEVSL